MLICLWCFIVCCLLCVINKVYEKMSSETLVKRLSEIFEKKLNKSGIVLTVNQLYQLAKQQKLQGLTKLFVAKFLQNQKSVAQFSAPAKQPKNFQTIGIPRPGVFFIDYAEFHRDWATSHNKGYTGFLVVVENLTNKLFAYPCRGKSSSEWESAVQQFIETTGYIRTIYSDRDAVATSPQFRDMIKQKYKLNWYFLVKGSKSYLAERYIRYLKEKLSQAMQIKNTKSWHQFLIPIVQEYNNETIAGTSFKRKKVGTHNFLAFLSQLLKLKDPELHFSSSKMNEFVNDTWNRKVFKFQPGDKVLVARRSDWSKKHSAFFKASHWGTFDPNEFTIGQRQLRLMKGLNHYVPVYSIVELGPKIHFYAEELKKIN